MSNRSTHKREGDRSPDLLHVFSPSKYVSPFDINMAYEANFDDVIPYCNVDLDEIYSLTQDTIFSRSPEGVRHTGIFIGGRDFDLAIAMLEKARAAMIPPFAVSVLADPSGAITTAAAMLAMVQHFLRLKFSGELSGRRVFVFGGTGPVGVCVALLASFAGAEAAIVSRQGAGAARRLAEDLAERYETPIHGADGSSPEAIAAILERAEIVFNAAKAGIRVLDAAQLAAAAELMIAADANAVPPPGIEGVKSKDAGAPLETGVEGAIGIGALAIGDIKYRVHTELLQMMLESDKPIYLAYREAFDVACRIVADRH